MRAKDLLSHMGADDSCAAERQKYGEGVAKHALWHCIFPHWKDRDAFAAMPWYLYAPTSGEAWERMIPDVQKRCADEMGKTVEEVYAPSKKNKEVPREAPIRIVRC